MKNTVKGFTLIELIVVFAIIGVLVAILVPSMLGYVSDSKYSTANSNAKLAYTNTAQWCTKCEVSGKSVVDCDFVADDLDVLISPDEVSYNGGDPDDLERELARTLGGKTNTGVVCGNITGQVPRWTQYRKTLIDMYIGSYPEPSSSKNPAVWTEELKQSK